MIDCKESTINTNNLNDLIINNNILTEQTKNIYSNE